MRGDKDGGGRVVVVRFFSLKRNSFGGRDLEREIAALRYMERNPLMLHKAGWNGRMKCKAHSTKSCKTISATRAVFLLLRFLREGGMPLRWHQQPVDKVGDINI